MNLIIKVYIMFLFSSAVQACCGLWRECFDETPMHVNQAVQEAQIAHISKDRLLEIFNALHDQWGTDTKVLVVQEEKSLAYALVELVSYQKGMPLKSYSKDVLLKWIESVYENFDLTSSLGD